VNRNSLSRKSIIQILALAALLITARLSFDLLSLIGFIYRDSSSGLLLIAIGIVGASLLFVIILAIVRLIQKRFVLGLVLLGLCCIPFLIPDFFNDGPDWKFRINKSAYLASIQSDLSAFPKYKVFEWQNENIPGGGIILAAIVYDETDEISQKPENRSAEWLEKRRLALPEERWITNDQQPRCRRYTRPFGEHFYYMSLVCS